MCHQHNTGRMWAQHTFFAQTPGSTTCRKAHRIDGPVSAASHYAKGAAIQALAGPTQAPVLKPTHQTDLVAETVCGKVRQCMRACGTVCRIR